jgi:hypothetical protein
MTILAPTRRFIGPAIAAAMLVGLLPCVTLGGGTLGDAGEAGDLPINLTSGVSTGDVAQVTAKLEVGGDLSLMTGGKLRKLPMSVVATFGYEERMLEVAAGLRSVRHYDQAEAVLKIEQRVLTPTLDDAHRRIVAQWSPDPAADQRTTMFSIAGPLTREQLELVDIVGNSLVVERLLPDEPVAVGESWDASARVMAALLRLDAVAVCDVQSVLGEVTDSRARIAMAGRVEGSTDGIATKIELKCSYDFSISHRRITRLRLAIKEKRAIGHVGPGVDVVATLDLVIEPLAAAKRLADVAADARPGLVDLTHVGGREDFRITHDRRWHVTADEPQLTVFRMLDRGEFVAQCNISELPRKAAERHLSLPEYQNDIRRALGDRFGEFVEASQWEDAAGNRVFRVIARGEVAQLPLEWRYYLIASETGRRLALSFTVEGPLAARLGDADRRLVDSVELLDAAATESSATSEASAEDVSTEEAPLKSARRPRRASRRRIQ